MRTRLLLLLLVCLAALVATGAAIATAGAKRSEPSGHRALWTWYWQGDDALADYAAANDFDRVFLFAEGGFDAKVVRAIKALNARGIGVEVLAGEKSWGVHPGPMLDFVREANSYQRHAAADARIDGVHLDVEPFDLPLWSRDHKLVLRRYLDGVHKAQTHSALPIGWDIPFWFDGERIGGHSYLSRLIGAADAVTIMSYRDSAEGILEAAKHEMSIGKRFGTPVTVGAETGDFKPASITFFQEGRAALESALGTIQNRLSPNPGFAGVAVHHYGSLKSLRP